MVYDFHDLQIRFSIWLGKKAGSLPSLKEKEARELEKQGVPPDEAKAASDQGVDDAWREFDEFYDKDLKKKRRPWRRLKVAEVVIIVVGTLLWGFGDLGNCFVDFGQEWNLRSCRIFM